MSKNSCPICGKTVNSFEMEFLDNGNPACKSCVHEEEKRKEAKADGKTIIKRKQKEH